MTDDAKQTYGVETAAAARDLLALMSGFEERFSKGDPALLDEQSVLESYRWIFTIVQVGMQAHLWADAQRPHFVDIVGRYQKWGGDNSDAFYQYAPIDPTKTYRVKARRADAVYWSLTIYGGPNDGRYSERIVGSVSDRDVTMDDDGRSRDHPLARRAPAAVDQARPGRGLRDHPRLPHRAGHQRAHGVEDRVRRR